MKQRLLSLLPFLVLSLLLFSYTFYRAYSFSLTCDEGSTFLNHLDRGFFDCMFNPDCWAAANNHLLNTKGMAVSASLFGPSEWALRLPNLLLHLCYIAASCVLVFLLSNRFLLRLFGFVLLNFQPILLEFFALARGYAMGAGFMMMALCFLALALKKQRPAWLVASLISGLLAVYSNFIFIVFLAAYAGMWLAISLFRGKNLPGAFRMTWGYAIAALAVMAVTVYTPVKTLGANQEFQFGIGSLFSAFTSLLRENLFRQLWLGEHTVPALTIVFLTASLASTAIGLRNEIRAPGKHLVHAATSLVFLMMVAFIAGNHWVLGAQYPDGRKMILFVPILGVLIWQLFVYLAERWQVASGVVMVAATLLLLDHMRYALNFEHTRTWYYDVCTKQFMLGLKEQVATMDREPTIGIFWTYSPASKFYIQTRDIPFSDVGRMDQITGKILFDYYYVDQNDTAQLMSQYHIFDHCGPYMILERNDLGPPGK